ncbi:hypothetical protein EPA93_39335 [Ktedonosporobacter rubrisoli]|uniref:Blue (type 1) copper domain-containing protein n=1 Tax=Ktedonosporobacter rubrisoli TaxID=2509675 RepID=A0A4P6K0X0_KTERU|nr:plastocyanin/azurin family copper-binding protein [Ktedonosporobacter rubrisoli]QBD81704.1 hypothetical protein EPA93_39335 [Ktedonosporobacter rubrisoli]
MKKLIVALTLFGLIAIVFAACGGGADSGSSSSASSGPAVHMDDTHFLPTSITIPKGSKLDLINDTGTAHIIQNGTWKDMSARPSIEPGAPKVDVQSVGSGTQTIGPFTTAGTFQLYCTVHPGMNLTVIVK